MKISQGSFLLGDNLEFCREMVAESIDLVITSPPYDDMRTYGGHSWDFKGLASEILRLLKPGGVVVWNIGDSTVNGSESGSSFRQALHFMDLGLCLADTMIWEKTGTSMGSNRVYHQNFEYMFVLSKGKHRVFNPLRDRPNVVVGKRRVGGGGLVDGRSRGGSREIESGQYGKRNNIWKIAPVRGSSKEGHPAPFPVALARDHILSWTNPGAVVLDPFGGSGTTAVASEETGREWLLIEQNPDYYWPAVARILDSLK